MMLESQNEFQRLRQAAEFRSYRMVHERRGHSRPSLKSILVLVSLLCFSIAATAAVVHANKSHQQDLHTMPTTTYMVEPGDTLWTIVSDHGLDKHEDTRSVIEDVMQLNHMQSADIQPGEVLVIPSGGGN